MFQRYEIVMSYLLCLSGFISRTMKLGTQASPSCRQFSIEELKEITRNFNLSTYIGEGSIGKVSFTHLKYSLIDIGQFPVFNFSLQITILCNKWFSFQFFYAFVLLEVDSI